MLNFNNPKTKKTFAAVIALILVVSMVLSVFLSAFVWKALVPVHNIQKELSYVNEIRGLCILKNCVFVLE